MTFIGTSALWICALIFTTSADKRIVKLRGESETLKREDDRLRSEAREMFVRYKSTVMTNPVITPNYGNLDVDNFTINPGSVTDWRSTLTPGRQADMEHLNSILVREMDQLRDLSKEFVVRFNQYVQATRDDVNELPMRGLEEYVQKDTERMLIFAIYAYHSRSLPPERREYDYGSLLSQNPTMQYNLARILTGDPQADFQTKIRQVVEKGTLLDLVRSAVEKHDSVTELYNRMMVKLRYEYSAET
jgi:hypothetical protein